MTVPLNLPICFNTPWNNRQICSKIGDPFTQTYLGQGVHVDETAALFSDLVFILQQSTAILLFLQQPQEAMFVPPIDCI